MAKAYSTDQLLIDKEALGEYKTKSDEAVDKKVQGVQTTVTEVQSSLGTLESTVTSQGLTINQNKEAISKNTQAIEGKVDKVEGSSLITTAKLAQIDTNANGVSTNAASIATNAGEIAKLKTDKADKSQLTGLATESYVDEKVSSIGDIKGSCLKSELEGKKAECGKNDVFIVTDDSNHMYYFNGTDFVDTNAVAHVDLSNYYDKATIDSSLSNKVDKVEGSSLVTTAQLNQIETNKASIASNASEISTLKTTLNDIKTDIGEFNSQLEALL